MSERIDKHPAVQSAIERFSDLDAHVFLAANELRPVFGIVTAARSHDSEFESAVMFLGVALSEAILGDQGWPYLRAVGADRLQVILKQGCDVEPANAVLWVNRSPSKVLEYGGDWKAVMVFHSTKLKPAYI